MCWTKHPTDFFCLTKFLRDFQNAQVKFTKRVKLYFDQRANDLLIATVILTLGTIDTGDQGDSDECYSAMSLTYK